MNKSNKHNRQQRLNASNKAATTTSKTTKAQAAVLSGISNKKENFQAPFAPHSKTTRKTTPEVIPVARQSTAANKKMSFKQANSATSTSTRRSQVSFFSSGFKIERMYPLFLYTVFSFINSILFVYLNYLF